MIDWTNFIFHHLLFSLSHFFFWLFSGHHWLVWAQALFLSGQTKPSFPSPFFFLFFFLNFRTTAQPWRRPCPSCPSPRPTATASADASGTRWLSSPKRRRSHRFHRHAKGLRQSTTCPWCHCWTSPTPLRRARPWQVETGHWQERENPPEHYFVVYSLLCVMRWTPLIPEDSAGNSSGRAGQDNVSWNCKKRRKSRDRRRLTDREERRRRSYQRSTRASPQLAEEEQQPGDSAGQVCCGSGNTGPVEGWCTVGEKKSVVGLLQWDQQNFENDVFKALLSKLLFLLT